MTTLTPSTLKRIYQLNILALSALIFLFGLVQVTHALSEFLFLISLALFVTYLLLGPVKFLTGVLNILLNTTLVPFRSWLKKILPPWATMSIPGVTPRLISVLLVYCSFFILIAIFTVRLFPTLGEQISAFQSQLPTYYSQLSTELKTMSRNIRQWSRLPGGLPLNAALSSPSVSQSSSQASGFQPALQDEAEKDAAKPTSALGELVRFFHHTASKTFGNIVGIATNSLTGLLYVFTSLVIIFYLLLDGASIRDGLVNLLPQKIQGQAQEFFRNAHHTLYCFLQKQLFFSLLGGWYLYLLFSLFHIDFPIFLSTFYGAAAILPVLGPLVGLLPSVMVILFSDAPATLILFLQLIALFFIVKEYWLGPLLFGDPLKVHPAAIILLFLVCFKIAGGVGILLTFPLLCLLSVAYQSFSQKTT